MLHLRDIKALPVSYGATDNVSHSKTISPHYKYTKTKGWLVLISQKYHCVFVSWEQELPWWTSPGLEWTPAWWLWAGGRLSAEDFPLQEASARAGSAHTTAPPQRGLGKQGTNTHDAITIYLILYIINWRICLSFSGFPEVQDIAWLINIPYTPVYRVRVIKLINGEGPNSAGALSPLPEQHKLNSLRECDMYVKEGLWCMLPVGCLGWNVSACVNLS